MKQLFAVIRSKGPNWNHGRRLEEQEDWPSHAAFMNDLEAEGFVLLGGPLEGTGEFLLIIRANDEDEIQARLGVDCWSRMRLLNIVRIVPWTLRLGSLG
jgi:uncharacterized protein YciI